MRSLTSRMSRRAGVSALGAFVSALLLPAALVAAPAATASPCAVPASALQAVLGPQVIPQPQYDSAGTSSVSYGGPTYHWTSYSCVYYVRGSRVTVVVNKPYAAALYAIGQKSARSAPNSAKYKTVAGLAGDKAYSYLIRYSNADIDAADAYVHGAQVTLNCGLLALSPPTVGKLLTAIVKHLPSS